MKLSDVFRILRKNIFLLIAFPVLLAVLVFYKTRNEEKEYTSSFLVYTGIASGYNLTTEEGHKIDHNAVNNAFDNLLTTVKARETVEEVGIRLIATHIRLKEPDERYVSAANFHRIRQLMSDSMEVKIRQAATLEEAVAILYNYRYASGNNAVKSIINSGFEIYGYPHISGKLVANRKALSDMMEVTYAANDPAVCQQTLEILSQVFIRKYKEIKQGEITNVVAYFENHTNNAYSKLKEAEERLKKFEVENKIINFDQQTKTISEAKQQLLDNIQKEKLVKSSAQATVANLESKVNLRKNVMETNQKILEKRQKLAELNYKLANGHLYSEKPAELAMIREQAEVLKEEIRVIVNDLYQINNSADGLARDDIMTQWLNNVLVLDESTARLQLMEGKLKDYDAMYDDYAPLGSTLTRLRREIDVAEKEYLNQLNALNLNKQRQQNIELTSSVRIVDKPFYPLHPKPSKRMTLVAGAFFAGFTLLFALLLGLEFFDSRIKTPARAEALTGLKLVGAMPYVRKNERRFDVEYLESSLMEQAISAIVLEIRQRSGMLNGTKYIMISSARSQEGKTWCAFKLASKLSEIRGKVLFMYPEDVSNEVKDMNELRLSDPALDLMSYAMTRDFLSKDEPGKLLDKKQVDFSKYSFVLIEIPPLSENQLPVELVKKMDISLLVIKADRKWVETDNYVTNLYRKACNCDPMILLNRVSPEGLKEIFGIIPKGKIRGIRKKQTQGSESVIEKA